MLGQEQDSAGGGFDATQSFQGMLSNVNIWDQELDATKIKDMSLSCQHDEEADRKVYKWLDFLREGGATVLKPSPCTLFGTGKWQFSKACFVNRESRHSGFLWNKNQLSKPYTTVRQRSLADCFWPNFIWPDFIYLLLLNLL